MFYVGFVEVAFFAVYVLSVGRRFFIHQLLRHFRRAAAGRHEVFCGSEGAQPARIADLNHRFIYRAALVANPAILDRLHRLPGILMTARSPVRYCLIVDDEIRFRQEARETFGDAKLRR